MVFRCRPRLRQSFPAGAARSVCSIGDEFTCGFAALARLHQHHRRMVAKRKLLLLARKTVPAIVPAHTRTITVRYGEQCTRKIAEVPD